jgi:hypothetical protein
VRNKFVGILTVAMVTGQVLAQSQRPLREARSENRRFVLRVEPGRATARADRPADAAPSQSDASVPAAESGADSARPGPDATSRASDSGDKPGRGAAAHGTLLERSDTRAEVRRWDRPLENDVAPVRGFVSDDGRFVVTLDELKRGGAAHAVVVYGESGKLKRDFSLRDLLKRGDWQKVKARRGAIEWLRGARFAFEVSPARFAIDLRWGRRIEIDLEAGELVGGPIERTSDANLPRAVRDALTGGHAETPDASPEQIAGYLERLKRGEKLTPDEAQALWDAYEANEFELSSDQKMWLEAWLDQEEPPDMEAAARLAAEQALQQGVEGGSLGEAIAKGLGEQLGIDLSAKIAQQALGLLAGGDLDGAIPAAGNSREYGPPVPPANPAHPVNYIEWYNAQTQVEGAPAAPLYEQVSKLMEANWPKDDEAMDAMLTSALDGDAAALSSAEVGAWLDKVRPAFDLVKQANALEYRGMPSESGDGTMIGILLPHVGRLRQAGRAMMIDAQRAELNGDLATATDRYMETFKLGAQTSHANTLIENLVGVAVQTKASESLLDSFEKNDAAIDYSAMAKRLESEYQPTRPVTEVFQFERAMILDVVQRGYEYDAEANTYRVSEAGLKQYRESMGMAGDNEMSEAAVGMYLGAVGFEGFHDAVNKHYDRLTEAAALPYPQGREQLAVIEREMENPVWQAGNPVLKSLLPALSKVTQVSYRNESQRRATNLVANLKAYKQANGSYPPSLDAFGGRDFTVDPLSGERFVYRPSGDDFTLYSVGVNGTDEGGLHDPMRRENDYQVWPRPPKPPANPR